MVSIEAIAKDFNSQPHEEADNADCLINRSFNISTHSLTKRLTILPIDRCAAIPYFNSQPHEEADD